MDRLLQEGPVKSVGLYIGTGSTSTDLIAGSGPKYVPGTDYDRVSGIGLWDWLLLKKYILKNVSVIHESPFPCLFWKQLKGE